MRKLYLLDYDGTLVWPDPNAFDSIVAAGNQVLGEYGRRRPDWQQWQEILEKTSGTTEERLTDELCDRAFLAGPERLEFQQRYYQARAGWLVAKRGEEESVGGTIYPDGLALLELLSQDPENILALATGNPKNSLEIRFEQGLNPFFQKADGGLRGAFGDETNSRQRLLRLAIWRVEREFPDFQIRRDARHYAMNVWYIADTRADLLAALKSRLRMVWIPSRTIDQSEAELRLFSLLDDTSVQEAHDREITQALIGHFGGGESYDSPKVVFPTNDLFHDWTLSFLGVEGDRLPVLERRGAVRGLTYEVARGRQPEVCGRAKER